MRQRILKIISIMAGILLLVGVLYWGGVITKITVSGDFTVDPSLKMTAEKCLEKYLNQSFWVLSDKTVRNSVLSCEKSFTHADISNSFPGKLNVTIYQLSALVKIESDNKNCTIIQNSATKVVVQPNKCSLYNVPVLKGIDIENNSFVQDYAATLVTLLRAHNIEVKSIELKGDTTAPWYHVIISDKTNVFLPSGVNIKDKVVILIAALNGLNTAKERYSTIDLRFDMVTYK